MCVITISRGSFSGGKLLAESLAATLGYRCVDRDAIIDRAALCGTSEAELRGALEKAPSFLDRFRHRKYLYLTLIRAALLEELREGRAVYHGNAGHLLLRGVPHVLRVRIIAPLEFRLRMARQRLGLGRDDALAHIRSVDEQRRKWTRYLYGVDWRNPALYDVVLNLEHMDLGEACSTVMAVLQQRCFQFTPACVAAMHDLALASRVQADLALNDSTSHLELEVTARAGVVQLQGKLTAIRDVEEIEPVVRQVPGVIDVSTEELVPPLYV